MNKLILSLQIAGFLAAVVALAVLWHHDPYTAYFVAAFAVHMAGDLMSVKKEGLPMSFKISNYVKPAPWAQFVGHMLLLGAIVGALTGHKAAFRVALAALVIAGAAYANRFKSLPPNDAALRLKLQVAGLAAALLGAILFWFAPNVGAWLCFIGTGLSLADFCYDLIY